MSHDGQDVLVRRVPQDVALYEPGKFNYASVFVLKDSPIGEFPFIILSDLKSTIF
jgi:hypothetical protein